MREPPEPDARPRYREYAPPPDLAPHVRCLWSIAAERTPLTPNRICPDGCADLVALGDGQIRAVGPMRSAVVMPLAGRVDIVGVRFHPGEAFAFFDVPLVELSDTTALPEELGWTDAGRIGDHFLETAEPAERLAVLAAALRGRLARLARRVAPARLRDAVRLLEQPGRGGVRGVRRALGMNERTLERQFAERVGLSPKTFERVARFGRAREQLQQRPHGLAAIAFAAGYVDQAHFSREFKALAGVTPAAYAREWDAVGFVQYGVPGGK